MPRLNCAKASPVAAARRSHCTAAAGSRRTPAPSRYIVARLVCAPTWPALAAVEIERQRPARCPAARRHRFRRGCRARSGRRDRRPRPGAGGRRATRSGGVWAAIGVTARHARRAVPRSGRTMGFGHCNEGATAGDLRRSPRAATALRASLAALLHLGALLGRQQLQHLGADPRLGQRQRAARLAHLRRGRFVHLPAFGRRRQRAPRLRHAIEQPAHLVAMLIDHGLSPARAAPR